MFPYSEGLPYDLVAEWDNKFVRVQVKSSNFTGVSVSFHCYCSNSSKSGNNRTDYTRDEIDGIAVYSQHTGECYWIPVEDLNKNKMSLNVEGNDPNPADEYILSDQFDVHN